MSVSRSGAVVVVAAAAGLLLGVARPVAAAGGTTQLLSVSSHGVPGGGDSRVDSISPDGRFVAFTSTAHFGANGKDQTSDVFLRDRARGTTRRVSVRVPRRAAGGPAYSASVSADGRWVAFLGSGPGFVDAVPEPTHVYLRDMQTGITTRVTDAADGGPADDNVEEMQMSADARRIVFWTAATNIVSPGGGTHDRYGVYLRDLPSGTTSRLDLLRSGRRPRVFSAPAAISGDGQRVAFASYADLTGDGKGFRARMFVRDLSTGVITRLSLLPTNEGYEFDRPSLDGDGSRLAYEVSVPTVADGERDLQLVVEDVASGSRVVVASAHETNADPGYPPVLSADGRHVAFLSPSSTLVPDDTNDRVDAFVCDLDTGRTERVNVTSTGQQAKLPADTYSAVALTADGSAVAFSTRDALVPADQRAKNDDAYLRLR